MKKDSSTTEDIARKTATKSETRPFREGETLAEPKRVRTIFQWLGRSLVLSSGSAPGDQRLGKRAQKTRNGRIVVQEESGPRKSRKNTKRILRFSWIPGTFTSFFDTIRYGLFVMVLGTPTRVRCRKRSPGAMGVNRRRFCTGGGRREGEIPGESKMPARMVSCRCAPAGASPFRMHFVLSKPYLGSMFPVRARTNHTREVNAKVRLCPITRHDKS